MRSPVNMLRKMLLALLLWQAGLSMSWAIDIHVVAETDAAAHYFANLLRKDVSSAHQVSVKPLASKKTSPPDIYVALSPRAYQGLISSNIPIIVLAPEPGTIQAREGDSVIYWSASLAQQLQLAHLLFPSLKRVGILGGNDIAGYRGLNRYAKEHGIELTWQGATAEAISRQSSDLIGRNDLLIAPYDPDVYNRDTIKAILLSTYRQGKVLIGPNATYVNAGALASVYYSSEALSEKVAQAIQSFTKNNYFTNGQAMKPEVMINHQVAKSLGINILNSHDISGRLEQLESRP